MIAFLIRQVTLIGLQLYRNKGLIAYLENSTRRKRRRSLQESQNDNNFTQLDYDNLQKNDNNNEKIINNNNFTIIINEYNFTNDNILYEFSVSFQLCFNNGKNYKNALNLLNNINQFAENILSQSQINYREFWIW